MPGRFARMLERLHPARLVREIEVPHDTVRGAYQLKSSVVYSSEEFESVLADFMRFYYMRMFHGFDPGNNFALGEAKRLLKQILDFDEALFRATSGTEGGLGSVLSAISEAWKREMLNNYVDNVMNECWNERNYEQCEEVFADFTEALRKYAPHSFEYISRVELIRNGKNVIKNYILSLRKYKNLWTKF